MYKGFESLKVWQKAREYRKEIYKLADKFPKKEQFGLISQITRAAISITANIAEGYGRYHWKENIQSCRLARGSLNEVIDHLYTARDCGYITKKEFENFYGKGREVERLLNGFIAYLRKRKK
jgi:four helix bundle protein